jgi:hypothetical protein
MFVFTGPGKRIEAPIPAWASSGRIDSMSPMTAALAVM